MRASSRPLLLRRIALFGLLIPLIVTSVVFANDAQLPANTLPSDDTGTLSVGSQPTGADVYIEDKFAGKTPITLSVRAGKHFLHMFMKDYNNWSEEITVEPDKELRVSATLEKSARPLPESKPMPIPRGITLCVAPMPGDFDSFIVGEMEKQQVPVTIIAADPYPGKGCDVSTSRYTMTGVVSLEGKSVSARAVFGIRLHLRDEVQAAVKLVRNNDSVVVWAGDSDRGEVKKVAEHIVNEMLKQRPIWLPSPINR